MNRGGSEILLGDLARALRCSPPFMRREAARLGVPVHPVHTGKPGRPALAVGEQEAARLALAFRLRMEYRIRGRTLYAVMRAVNDPAAVKRVGRRVLVDGTGEWRDVLTGQLWLLLPDLHRGKR